MYILLQTNQNSALKNATGFDVDFVDILERGSNATNQISQKWDNLWVSFLNLSSDPSTLNISAYSLIGLITWVAYLFACLAMCYFAVKNLNYLLENQIKEYFLNILVAFLVVILLANNSYYTRVYCYMSKITINHINQTVLNGAIAGASLQKSFKKYVRTVGFKQAAGEMLQSCETFTGAEQTQCIEQATVRLEEMIDEAKSRNLIDWDDIGETFRVVVNWLRINLNPVVGGAAFLTSLIFTTNWQNAAFGILSSVMRAYQEGIEIALFLTAIITPLAVALSLLPVRDKAIVLHFIAFFSVGLAKLYFNIMTGVAASLAADDSSGIVLGSETLGIYILFAVFAPYYSAALAKRGGMAVFEALVRAFNDTVGAAARIVDSVI